MNLVCYDSLRSSTAQVRISEFTIQFILNPRRLHPAAAGTGQKAKGSDKSMDKEHDAHSADSARGAYNYGDSFQVLCESKAGASCGQSRRAQLVATGSCSLHFFATALARRVTGMHVSTGVCRWGFRPHTAAKVAGAPPFHRARRGNAQGPLVPNVPTCSRLYPVTA